MGKKSPWGNIFSANKGRRWKMERLLAELSGFCKVCLRPACAEFFAVGVPIAQSLFVPDNAARRLLVFQHSGCITCKLPRQQSHSTAKVFNWNDTFLFDW